MSNVTKSWFLIGLFSLTILILGHKIGGREGLLWSMIFSLGINCFIYFFASKNIINVFSTREIEGQDPWGVLLKTRVLANKARVPTPKVTVLHNKSPQAFAMGRNSYHAQIVLTDGLLNILDAEELNAILAYQIAIIKKQDLLAFTLASLISKILLKTTSILDAIFRWIIVEKNRPESTLGQIFTKSLSPVFGAILKLTVSQKTYFVADELAAELCGNSQKLASALWKLDSYSYTKPFVAPIFTSHLFVVNPLTKKSWTRYFHAQPTTKVRIEKLIGYYPI